MKKEYQNKKKDGEAVWTGLLCLAPFLLLLEMFDCYTLVGTWFSDHSRDCLTSRESGWTPWKPSDFFFGKVACEAKCSSVAMDRCRVTILY